MELTNQFVSSDTNKTAEIVIRLVEPPSVHSYTHWMDNLYNSPELAHFLKSKETDCVGTICVNRENVLPLVIGKKLKGKNVM
jgi:hypothetical protein